jgi:glycosyltransferase involved in cell wall biosynthesis
VNNTNRPAVSIIIPAYNEQQGIAGQVGDVQQVMASINLEHEIIVIDDGSEDNTAVEAEKAGAHVYSHDQNRGYGASLKTGIQSASNEFIVITDGDGTYPSEYIPELIQVLENADMVVGARVGEEVSVPWIRQPAKFILRKLAARIAEQAIPDLNSGLRAFRGECIRQYFPILPNSFSFTSTVTLAYMADNYYVQYVPISYRNRVGKSKIVPWHFMDFLILIIRLSMMFNPLKIFLPLALIVGGLGVLKAIYDFAALFARHDAWDVSLFLQPALSTSAVLLLFTGLQLLMIGMVADGIIRRIAQHNRPLVPSHRDWNKTPPSAGSPEINFEQGKES